MINAGNNLFPSIFGFLNDQRGSGVPRIKDTTVDIGAVELQNIENGASLPLNPNEILTRRDMARELLKVRLALYFPLFVPFIPSYALGGLLNNLP